MRITIVQGAFFPVPPIRGGAVEKVWHALGREFARRGHTVTHVSRLCDNLPKEETLEGVRYVRVAGYDTPRSGLWLKWLDLLYTFRTGRVLPEADILVSNTFWLPILGPRRSRGLVYVHVARYPKGQMKYYPGSARLQAVSQAVADAVCHDLRVPTISSRVTVIPNPLPDDAWTPKPPLDSERAPMVLYAGRIHPEKGLDMLAEAWTQPWARKGLAGWKLVLAGPWAVASGGGGEEYKAQLERKFASAADTVEWTGPLFGADTAKLHQLYQNARLFVYPSVAERGESFGLAPLEAMAAGAPCVVSDLGCFRDFIEHNVNGMAFDHRTSKPADPLANLLVELAGNAEKRTQLAAAAWATAANYRVEEVASLYLNDFESWLAKNNS